ncbi:MAG: glycosyltransferase family 9 protein [Nitrospirales bacterium]
MKHRPRHILILKPSSLGDVVHALPTLAVLRRHYPSSRITWLIKEEWAEMLEGNPDLDDVISVKFGLRYWPSLIGRVREQQFDLVVDLQGLFRTGLLARVSGAAVRIGFAASREGSSWFYTDRVELPIPMDRPWRLLPMHAVDRNLVVAQYLGADISQVGFSIPQIESDQVVVEKWLSEAGVQPEDRLIAMAPLSREDVKCWPLDRFVTLAQEISHWPNCKVVLLGSDAQQWMVKSFSRLIETGLVNMVGTLRLRQLGPLLRHTHLLIANDSAPIHIAAAVGVPVLGFFGPTHAVATGPYGTNHHRIMNTDLSCRPCGKKVCHHGIQKECLTAISVQDVVTEISQMLREARLSPLSV